MKNPVGTQTLPNGIQYYTVPVPRAKMVEVRLYFKAGFEYFTAEQYHLPHLLEHALIGNGAATNGEEAFIGQLQAIGAFANASTDYQHVEVSLRAPAAAINQALQLVLDSVFAAQLTEAVVAKEKDIIIREIHEQFDGLGGRVLNHLLHKGFASITPENWSDHFTVTEQLDLPAVKAAYKTFIRTGNMQVVIAGDGRTITAPAIMEQFAALSAGKSTAAKIRTSKPEQSVVEPLHLNLDESASISLLFTSDSSGDDPGKRAARNIASMMLFDAPSAKLNISLREQGIIYSIDTSLMRINDKEVFVVHIMAKAGKAHIAALETFKHIQLHAAGAFSDDELAAVKQFASVSIETFDETVEGTLEWYALDILNQRQPRTPAQEITSVKAVTKADVTQAASDIFAASTVYGAVAVADAAFWVPQFDVIRADLAKLTDESAILTKATDANLELTTLRAEAPERVGYHWAAYYYLGYAVLLLLIFAPMVPVADKLVKVVDLSSSHPIWVISLVGAQTLSGATGWVSGGKEWLAQRIGILLYGVAAALFIIGFFAYLGGFASIGLHNSQTLLLIVPLAFYALATPLAVLSVVRLSLRDNFKR